MFRHVDALTGGFNAPVPKTGAMRSFYETGDQPVSNFQARYIVLHRSSTLLKDLKCSKDRRASSFWSYDAQKGVERAERFYEEKSRFTPKNVGEALVNAREAGLEL